MSMWKLDIHNYGSFVIAFTRHKILYTTMMAFMGIFQAMSDV